MVGLVTLNQILRFVLRGVVHVAFDANIRSDPLEDDAANSARFRVPFHVVPPFERSRHAVLPPLITRCAETAWSQYPANLRCVRDQLLCLTLRNLVHSDFKYSTRSLFC